MFIKITNNIPQLYTINQLRMDNPTVSFPQDIPISTLQQFGVFPVNQITAPIYNPETHYLKQSDFYQVDGQWQVHYSVEPLPIAQIAERVRAQRNALLSDSDWVIAVSYEQQIAVPPEWSAYRQALRDITSQAGFPYTVLWPVKPDK